MFAVMRSMRVPPSSPRSTSTSRPRSWKCSCACSACAVGHSCAKASSPSTASISSCHGIVVWPSTVRGVIGASIFNTAVATRAWINARLSQARVPVPQSVGISGFSAAASADCRRRCRPSCGNAEGSAGSSSEPSPVACEASVFSVSDETSRRQSAPMRRQARSPLSDSIGTARSNSSGIVKVSSVSASFRRPPDESASTVPSMPAKPVCVASAARPNPLSRALSA